MVKIWKICQKTESHLYYNGTTWRDKNKYKENCNSAKHSPRDQISLTLNIYINKLSVKDRIKLLTSKKASNSLASPKCFLGKDGRYFYVLVYYIVNANLS